MTSSFGGGTGRPERATCLGALTGASSTVVAVLAANPWESMKVRAQSQSTGWRMFSSRAAFSQLLRKPFAGVPAHVVSYMPMNVVRFAAYEAAKPAVGWPAGVRQAPRWWQPFAAGGASGLACAAAIHPLWVVKTYQQAHRVTTPAAVRALTDMHGVRGLCLTWPLGFVRFGVALSVFFGTYDVVKRTIGADKISEHSPGTAFGLRAVAGGCSGVLTWTSIYPIDVLQSRVVARSMEYQGGTIATARSLLAEGGWRIFTRGYAAVLMRSIPVNAMLLPVADVLRAFYDRTLPA